jgi:hypothetical protein
MNIMKLTCTWIQGTIIFNGFLVFHLKCILAV